MPVTKEVSNPFWRAYQCQSCHWRGDMIRFIRKQSKLGIFLTKGAIISLFVVAIWVLIELFQFLPE